MSAPERIWATVNGASTRLPDGTRQLIGGWSEDKDRPRAVEYVRADLARRQSPAGVVKPLEWGPKGGTHGIYAEDGFGGLYFAYDDGAWSSPRKSFPAPLDGSGSIETAKVAAQADYERRILSSLSVKEPEGAEPVAWFIPPDADGVYQQVSPQHYGDPDLVPLYASSQPKAVTITDEMRQAIRVLKLIADGFSAKGDGLGEFVQVENPYYQPDNGSDPYIVVDIASLEAQDGGK